MKIKKLIGLCAAFILSITGFVVFSSTSSIVATADIASSSLWKLSSGAILSKDDDTSFTKIILSDDSSAKFQRDVDIKNFKLEFKIASTQFKSINLEFIAKALTDSSESNVKNSIKFVVDNNALKVSLNDKAAVTLSGAVTDNLTMTIINDEIKINNTLIGKIDEVGKYIATLAFVADTENKEVPIIISSLNEQALKLNNDKNIIIDNTNIDQKPRIVFHKDITNQDFYIPDGFIYELSFSGVDVLSSTSTEVKYKKTIDTEFKTVENNKICLPTGSYNLIFKVTDSNNSDSFAEQSITLNVKNDMESPKVIANDTFYTDYQTKVENLVYKDSAKEKGYVFMGSGEYFKLPNFTGLFDDDVTFGSDLKYNLKYSTPTAERTITKTSASGLKIELTEEGKYSFEIQAIDQKGNTSKYSKPFSFYIENTAGPQITAPTSNDDGYQNTSYTSNSFTIKGINTKTTYELMYLDNDKWVKAEEELSSLTFTPKKLGKYKIICSVIDKTIIDSKDALTAETVFNITDKPTIVKGDIQWAKNNIISVVCLCTGLLSLIGIIVLLLIKPKDETKK